MPLDPTQVARFTADLRRLLGAEEPGPERPLALAVSGGPDSMAMLALAAGAFPGAVIAATVDHRLRQESAGEAAMVGDWCSEQGLTHAGLTIEAAPTVSGNLHAWARQERYLLLRRWAANAGAGALLTAHHADDQAETFLMRAARGSGLSGLAAVRARIDDEVLFPNGPGWPADTDVPSLVARPLALLRPLLDWRRSELRAVAEAAGVPFADDPSNDDARFERARLRAWLADAAWLDAVKVSRSAQALAEADADLLAMSRWLWRERGTHAGAADCRIDVADLPRGVCRWLARTAIDGVLTASGSGRGTWSYATDIEPLLNALEAGRGATQAGVMASAQGTNWRFRMAPPRRSH